VAAVTRAIASLHAAAIKGCIRQTLAELVCSDSYTMKAVASWWLMPLYCGADVIAIHHHHHHHFYTSSSGRPVGCMSTLLKQHVNTYKQQSRTLGLQIIIHHTHAPVHKQSHRLTITTTHQGIKAIALRD
jgi:hypothetical protein